MLTLPRSARLVLWANAWLADSASPDDVLAAVRGRDDADTATEFGVLNTLARLRKTKAAGLRLALPTPGDPLGLGGPAALNEAALAAGEAALAVGAPIAFVPQVEMYGPEGDQGVSVSWQEHPAERVPVVDDLATAERSLKEGLIAAAGLMSSLDMASWSDEAGAALANIRAGLPTRVVPTAYGARALTVLGQGVRLRAIAELALRDDGGAVTAAQAQRRRETLMPLDRIGRVGIVAACGSLFEPGALLGGPRTPAHPA